MFEYGKLFIQTVLSTCSETELSEMVYFSRKDYLITTVYIAQTHFTPFSNFKNLHFSFSVILDCALILIRKFNIAKMVSTRRRTLTVGDQKKGSNKKVVKESLRRLWSTSTG